MDQDRKREFIAELIDNVKREILEKVAYMPEEWDGHELRRYIADRFDQAAFTVHRGAKDPGYRRRFRAYRNELMTRPL